VPARDLDPASLRAVLDLISGKWVPHVLIALVDRPLRHGQLRKAVGQTVNDKVFTQTLRRMEADGLVLRNVLDGTPPAVLYRLTPTGQSFLEPLAVLTRWYRLVQADDADNASQL
jgi:DNA-binding HxlR family transcriptional regulator